MDPIKIGAFLIITRSIEDHRNGPIFRIAALREKVAKGTATVFGIKDNSDVKVTPDIYIEGSTSVLGMKRNVKIVCNRRGFLFMLEGQLFGGIFLAKIKFQIKMPMNKMTDASQGLSLEAISKIKVKFHVVFAVGQVWKTLSAGVAKAVKYSKKLIGLVKKYRAKMKETMKKLGLAKLRLGE